MVLIETFKKTLNWFAPWELFSLQFYLSVEKTIIKFNFSSRHTIKYPLPILFSIFLTNLLILFSNADLIDLTLYEF